MDVNDECEGGVDLTSFEIVNLSSSGRFDLTEEEREEIKESKEKIKLKTKLKSAWNNVKYGGWSLKTKPRLSKSSPVYLLGQSYELNYSGEREYFSRAFSSLLWLTYRKGFTPLDGSALTSDAGWGCTLRSAQMLLAQGLILHVMPTGWTWPITHHRTKDDLEIVDPHVLDDSLRDYPSRSRKHRRHSLDTTLNRPTHDDEITHRRLVSWFSDVSSAPFGLHRLVEFGKVSGKRAGDWYGPSIVAHILQKAVAASEDLNLVVYIAQDCTIYVGDVLDLCGSSDVWKSLILLVPVRLGGDVLNPAYTPCVKRLLMLRSCIGIVGGKPKRSFFFVGFQDDQLIYLDPHYCQAAVDVKEENFSLESFHCKTVKKMSFNRMDPCCTLGFYAKNGEDFQTLRSDVTMALASSKEKYPIFTFLEGHAEVEDGCVSDSVPHTEKNKERKRRKEKKNSTDEFVLL